LNNKPAWQPNGEGAERLGIGRDQRGRGLRSGGEKEGEWGERGPAAKTLDFTELPY